MQGLFGSSARSSMSPSSVEFKAGKMTMNTSSKMVTPDKRKGKIHVHQGDDSLMHFCWKDRSNSDSVEDDLIIFPDDVEFKRVAECTTGRVFVLKFKTSSKKMFFWMQEPKTDKDEELCKKVNDLLNNPPAPGSGGGGGGALPDLSGGGVGESDIHNLLGGMNQQQLMQLLTGMGGVSGISSLLGGGGGGGGTRTTSQESAPPSRVQSSPGPRVSQTPTESGPQRPSTVSVTNTPAQSGAQAMDTSAADQPNIKLEDLQSVLSGMQMQGGEGGKEVVDLSTVSSELIPILAKPEVQARLMEHLPEGESIPKTEAELKNTIGSPQFQQALSGFSAALASGQLGPLMQQFGLGDAAVAAATQGDVDAFAKAIQDNLDKTKKEDKPEEK